MIDNKKLQEILTSMVEVVPTEHRTLVFSLMSEAYELGVNQMSKDMAPNERAAEVKRIRDMIGKLSDELEILMIGASGVERFLMESAGENLDGAKGMLIGASRFKNFHAKDHSEK